MQQKRSVMRGIGLRLTPHGRLMLEEAEEAPILDERVAVRLAKAFAEGTGQGLLQLGAGEVGQALPPAFMWWRGFSTQYVVALCLLTPEIADGAPVPGVPAPSEADLASLVLTAPMMPGAEYITADLLRELWHQVSQAFSHLQIAPYEIRAMVSGSSLYHVTIRIGALPKAQWQATCRDCAGGIDSLVELLQGRFSKGVMERICQQGKGLFPKPSEIKFSCSCPDYASMCKHIAAVLYGVGARLDQQPELLFQLRAVNQNELVANLDSALPLVKAGPDAARLLADDDISALFGLEMEEEPSATPVPNTPARRKKNGAGTVTNRRKTTSKRGTTPGKAASNKTTARASKASTKTKEWR
jgi:uncharacterized Zn finger protein